MADETQPRRRRKRQNQLTEDGARLPATKKLEIEWLKPREVKEGEGSCFVHISNTNGLSTLTVPDLRNLLSTINDNALKIPLEGKGTMYKIKLSVSLVNEPLSSVVHKLKFSDRMLIASILTRPDGGSDISPFQKIRIGGWVITGRLERGGALLEVNDGSCLEDLHVLVDASVCSLEKLYELCKVGTSVHLDGFLKFSLESKRIELNAREIIHVGTVEDTVKYPMSNLRDFPHLRARDNTIGCVSRHRHKLVLASHGFFEKHCFLWVSTPIIITSSDSEGGGEMFQVTTLTKEEDGKIDFFGRQAYLSTSGQLHLESYACALGSVYRFGPVFRVENSHSSKHLAEFWMVECVIAFANLEDIMNCAEAYVKYMCKWLKSVVPTPVPTTFERVTYTEAINLLEEAVAKGKIVFEKQVEWGMELASEHERYLTDVQFQMKPVIVYNYPKGIKAFYMRLNDDGTTVAAMDLLVPTVGKIIGGSQREERYDILKNRMEEMEIPIEQYEWYLDLRRYGTVKHSGFGLGFERMLLFVTGLDNIRDVSPFPRYKAEL